MSSKTKGLSRATGTIYGNEEGPLGRQRDLRGKSTSEDRFHEHRLLKTLGLSSVIKKLSGSDSKRFPFDNVDSSTATTVGQSGRVIVRKGRLISSEATK
jgi:hypothetical protein